MLEMSVVAGAGAVYSARSCQAMHEKRSRARAGRDLHSWVERMAECINGSRRNMKASIAGGVGECIDG